MNTFQFSPFSVDVYTDFVDDEVIWYIEFTDDDGLVNRYRIVRYPYPVHKRIQVDYVFELVRPSSGEILKSGRSSYPDRL